MDRVIDKALKIAQGKVRPIRFHQTIAQRGYSEGGAALTTGEPMSAPERPQTLALQMQQLANGKRAAVFVAKGSKLGNIPEDMDVINTREGDIYFNPELISGEEVTEAATSGRLNELLDYVQSKPEAIEESLEQGETPRVVVSRDADGIEQDAAAVSPDRVEEQAEIFADRANDGSTISEEDLNSPVVRDRLAEGGVPDEESQEAFLKKELEGSAPQYDPEGGKETAKEAGRFIAGMTTPGAIADAAGYLGGPSALENWKQGNKGTAALQVAGALPVVGPLAKAGMGAHLAMSMVPKARAVEDALRIAKETKPTITSALEAKHPNVDFVLAENKSGPLTLNKVVVPKEHRGKGLGTSFMNDLLAQADESGRTVALSPSEDFGGNKNKLNEWYKSLGFVPNKGRTKDFSFRETMYRPPKVEDNSIENAARLAKGLPMDEPTRVGRATEQGYTGPWYHGSQRTDRLLEGKSINPKRATSGPMPFFTDNPDVASNYAMGKQDTSRMAADEGNVASYFTVHPKELGWSGRTEMPVEQTWYFLPQETKQKILENYGKIGYADRDQATGDLVLHPEFGGLSSQDHYNYILKNEAKGNPLTALRNIWYEGGDLVNNPEQLADIYKLAGYPHQISQKNAPWTEAKGVMPAMLRMENPLTTHNAEEINEKVIPHLEQAFAKDRTRKTTGSNSDMWDKNYRYTPKEWVAQLKEDMAKGDNSYAWTSIPDKVTEQLKALGYDGILDTGGKGGGQGHTVAIPFHSHQVRSKFAKFDPKHLGKADLLKSSGGEVESALRLAKSNRKR